ncbi:hypothetical protein CARUB_v10004867mg [Capsella rubella]|uniref:DUF4378 domain-containing protein n=1 Tax=Capsella rubella TaxID=81985 RepID=R0GWI0_9BRAS|nr:uncharacterized protein LOC17879117 [Capsella rubella]EOA16675.1 hypothetical protein CARUB_v10004867mg [Capsella rubella]
MASISSSSDHHHLPVSKRRLKPLILRDYLLEDLSSCSSNGFKSFPRILDAEIKRSRTIHHTPRLTCGLAFGHAVHKASSALLTAVKLLPFPSSVKKRDDENKKGLFSRTFWKIKPSRRELNVVDGDGDGENEQETEDDREKEIQRWRTFAEFLQESQDLYQPSDQVSHVPSTYSFSGEAALSNDAVGDSLSFSSENSEGTHSSSSSGEVAVMTSGDCVGLHVSDNAEECVNEEKEQLSPISILECPFEDDAISPPLHHLKANEIKQTRVCRRFGSFVRLEPVDLEKRIEIYVESQDSNYHVTKPKEDQSQIRANRLFALVKSRITEEQNHLLASHVVDNVMLDFFKENGNNETRDENKLVEIVEEWVTRRQEEEYNMFMSWAVRENREIYVKEMKWGCINRDGREYVVEELGNGFVSSLIDELILDLS